MSKRIYTLLIGIFIFVSSSQAQIALSFEPGNADPGGTVEIDVSISDFTDIASIQYGVIYDSTVLNFNSITNINTDLIGFTSGSINTPGNDPESLDEGNITVSWSWDFLDDDATTIPDGVFFTMVFDAVGEACDTTTMGLYTGNNNEPLNIQVVNTNFEEIPLAHNVSSVLINGTDCGGGSGGEGDVTFIIPNNTNLEVGQDTCIGVTVENFDDVLGFQFPIVWDTTILQYNGFNVPAGSVTGLQMPEGDNSGELFALWFDNTTNGVSLDDGTVVFELCFTAIGDPGDVSPLTFGPADYDPAVFGDDDLPFFLDDGQVTITDGPVEDLTFIVSEEVMLDGGEGCVEVTALHFDNISSFQAHITFDNSILQYQDIQMTNLPGLNPDLFDYDINDNLITVSWTSADSEGIDFPDDQVMFEICFTELIDCVSSPADKTGEVEILNDSFLQAVTGTTEDPIEILPLLVAGSITVQCDLECIIVEVDPPACHGEAGGNITVNVLDAPVGCVGVWTNGDGTQVGSTLTPNCNLLGVPAGTYTLVVTCGTEEYCTVTVPMDEPEPLAANETVTPITCTMDGMIQLAVTGGTGSYSYAWSGGLTGDDKVNVSTPGDYVVTITDEEDCDLIETINVSSNASGIESITFNVTDILCNGDSNGAITAVPNGGCPPYTFAWTPTASGSTISDLGAGTYTVTISDALNNTISDSYNLTEPDDITSTSSAIAATGTINLTAPVGGTGPYTYLWSPGDYDTQSISGVDPGTYTVTITDDNDCTLVLTQELLPPGGFTIDEILPAGNFNGFNIECGGECSGVVNFSVNSGTLPITVTLTNGNSTSMKTIMAYGNGLIEDVCAGTGVVLTATDGDGETFTSDAFDITAPPVLSISAEKQCPDPDMSNGLISVTVTGGVPSYTYIWSPPNVDGPVIDDLVNDTYNVMVTDQNGCQVMLNNDLTAATCDSDPTCYKATGAITPNGDGVNDLFVISCAMKYDNILTVYDRYGKEVFRQVNYDNTWDGDQNIEGGYMWVLKANFNNGENKTYKGTLAIIR